MNNRKQTYAAIEKMLMKLEDPFTRFLEPAKLLALKEGTKGVLTGVGMELAYSSNPQTEPELTVKSILYQSSSILILGDFSCS